MFSSANNDRIRQLAWQKAVSISEMARAMAQSGRGYALNRWWLDGKVEAAAHDIRSELNLGVVVANGKYDGDDGGYGRYNSGGYDGRDGYGGSGGMGGGGGSSYY